MGKAQFKTGDEALSRDGHPVKILRIYNEGGEHWFAEVEYLDGHMPYPDPNGRVGGTYESPTWEHRLYDGKVLRSGGDYYNDADWILEEGLRPLREVDIFAEEVERSSVLAALSPEVRRSIARNARHAPAVNAKRADNEGA